MHSRRLRRTISLVSGSLLRKIESLWGHPRLPELYPEFLFATLGVICASTPILETAAQEAELRSAEGDALCRVLAPYLREHAAEENGHDLWLLDDLEVCGILRDRVLERVPYVSAAVLAGTQHFWVRHAHPVAVLGYLAVLENPASPEYLREVARRTGIPLAAMSTLLRHAELDVTHVAEFDAMLDGLELGQRELDVLTTSAIAAVAQLDAFFADVLEHIGRADEAELSHTIFRREASPVTAGSGEVASPSVLAV
jgi:hypothetical protein